MTARAIRALTTPFARLGQRLPHGWRDFVLQLAIWLGFGLAYQIARGIADRDVSQAFQNGRGIIDFESRLHALIELDLQRVVLSAGDWLVQAVNWTYWNSQFTVVGLVLLWVYFKRNDVVPPPSQHPAADQHAGARGLRAVADRTAPPVPRVGLRRHARLLLDPQPRQRARPARLESVRRDAEHPRRERAHRRLLHGLGLVRSRPAKLLWTLWPSWVWFTVMATANHFWLDVAAGIGLALLSASIVVGLADPAALATTSPGPHRASVGAVEPLASPP